MLTLTALVLLAAAPTLPPMVQAEPDVIRVSSTVRKATLLEVEPSSAGALMGRALLAPVLGVVGGGVAGTLGGLAGMALGGGSWGGLALGVVLGGAVGLVGLAVGIALGAALFSDDVGALFKASLGWAFAAVGVGGLAFLIAALALPGIGVVVGIAAAVVTAAAVPFVVEARRLAVAAEEKERSAVPVMTF